MFFYVIQLGAILAVVVIYFHKLNPFSPSKTKEEKTQTWDIWKKSGHQAHSGWSHRLAFERLGRTKTFTNATVVALALIIYGILFIVIENKHKDREPSITDFSQLTYMKAFQIGLFQALSIIPGTSRSGSSIKEHRVGHFPLHRDGIFLLHEHSDYVRDQLLKIIKFGF